MKFLCLGLALLFLSDAQAQSAPAQFSGHLRGQWDGVLANQAGPMAAANMLQPGLLAAPVNTSKLETELRASGHGISAVLTLQQQDPSASAQNAQAWVNELVASHDGGAWQFSAGKKIVAWDVGYGFRPNDMVQQEERRTLGNSTPQGRPMLLAEHFDADTAWSWVWVNPSASVQALGAQEPALAARVYQRQGAADWYGFARMGARTGVSTGVALAWVASDALELHSSVKYSNRLDAQFMSPNSNGLVASNPWQQGSLTAVTQWLVGGTWTSQNQLSLLAEAWWDGSAPTDDQWSAWSLRNQQLDTLATLGAPTAAVAGNLAWQAQGLTGGQNLRRRNVFVRLSWENGVWKPAFDILYTPADQGRAVTASLTWQGDRVQVQTGLRAYGAAANAVFAMLPTRRMGFVALTMAF
jgi:hypothetical protein